jgi:hypothetical protein
MYFALDCKLGNRVKIQNLTDFVLGIMLQLKLVKSANDEKAITTAAAKDEDKDKDNAATANAKKKMRVLLELKEPWQRR